jgi:hypothetical protein
MHDPWQSRALHYIDFFTAHRWSYTSPSPVLLWHANIPKLIYDKMF